MGKNIEELLAIRPQRATHSLPTILQPKSKYIPAPKTRAQALSHLLKTRPWAKDRHGGFEARGGIEGTRWSTDTKHTSIDGKVERRPKAYGHGSSMAASSVAKWQQQQGLSNRGSRTPQPPIGSPTIGSYVRYFKEELNIMHPLSTLTPSQLRMTPSEHYATFQHYDTSVHYDTFEHYDTSEHYDATEEDATEKEATEIDTTEKEGTEEDATENTEENTTEKDATEVENAEEDASEKWDAEEFHPEEDASEEDAAEHYDTAERVIEDAAEHYDTAEEDAAEHSGMTPLSELLKFQTPVAL